MDNKSFGEKIARLRKEQHLTQARLAEKLHISNKTISRWETGEGYPEITLLAPLAEALGTTTDELLKEASKKNDSDNEAHAENPDKKRRGKPIVFWKGLTFFNKVGVIGIGLPVLSFTFNFVIMLLDSSGDYNSDFALIFVPICAFFFTTVPKVCGVVTALGVLLGLLNQYEKQYKAGIILTIINFCLPYAMLFLMYIPM